VFAGVLAVFACPVGAAQAIEAGVEGATLVLAPTAGDRSLSAHVGFVPGPCAWPADGGRTLSDPAGCVVTDVPDRTPGPGCVLTDGFERPEHLTACGLSGVTRVEVRGGSGDDRILFEPGYAFGGDTAVVTGDGPDDVQAVDGAVERIDCGGGADTAQEDPADVSTGCEDGNGTVDPAAGARDGRIERRGDALVVDYGTARGNELRRVVADIGHAEGGAIGIGTLARGPVALGDGCTVRQRSGDAICDGAGLASIEVRAPRSASDLFRLEVALGGERPFGGPVTVRGGPGPSTIDVHDGIAEHVDCGLAFDSVVADARDTVAGSCEASRGEGTLQAQSPGVVRPRAGVHSGRQRSWHGNVGQAIMVKIACPAVVADGCGGIAEATLTRGSRVAFGATAYAVAPGRTATVGIVGGVDAGAFHAAKERITRSRYFAELRAHGDLKATIVTARGFGAHRTSKTYRVTAR
jgi:hypothetical protein